MEEQKDTVSFKYNFPDLQRSGIPLIECNAFTQYGQRIFRVKSRKVKYRVPMNVLRSFVGATLNRKWIRKEDSMYQMRADKYKAGKWSYKSLRPRVSRFRRGPLLLENIIQTSPNPDKTPSILT
jgi:hypothetical protein